MDQKSFEEMDQSLMESLKPLKDQPLPKEIFEGFDQEVKKKILEQEAAQAMGMRIGFAVALALAAAGIWFFVLQAQMSTEKPVAPSVVSEENQIKETPKANIVEESAQFREVAEKSIPVVSESSAPLTEIEQNEMLSDIEALRELGVWTDEDDEALGITFEMSLGDLELDIEQDEFVVPTPSPVVG